ncbi:MAG: hypothetical protein ACNFW9_00950 [Candidatus Kerfeldbacteria bacterium]
MFTKFDKCLIALCFIYVFGGIFILSNSVVPGADGATSLTHEGYPLFVQSTIIADLMDGHYTVHQQLSGGYTNVIHHQPGDKDFMYVVALRITDDLKHRRIGEKFTVYNNRIITPLASSTIRAI